MSILRQSQIEILAIDGIHKSSGAARNSSIAVAPLSDRDLHHWAMCSTRCPILICPSAGSLGLNPRRQDADKTGEMVGRLSGRMKNRQPLGRKHQRGELPSVAIAVLALTNSFWSDCNDYER